MMETSLNVHTKQKFIIQCAQICVRKWMRLTGDGDDFERTPTRATKSTGQRGTCTVNDKERIIQC